MSVSNGWLIHSPSVCGRSATLPLIEFVHDRVHFGIFSHSLPRDSANAVARHFSVFWRNPSTWLDQPLADLGPAALPLTESWIIRSRE